MDVSEHPLEFSETFPCRDDIGGFRATVQLTCTVYDPADVVRRGIHDVARVMVPPLVETLRRACGAFAAEEFDAAEQAALTGVRMKEAEARHDPAFTIGRFHCVLGLDEAAATYVRERKEATRNL